MNETSGFPPPTRTCPQCGKRAAVWIVRGLPGQAAIEANAEGLVELGGCLVQPNDPDWSCRECHYQWREDN